MSLTTTHIISKKYLKNSLPYEGKTYVKNEFLNFMEFKIQVAKKKIKIKTKQKKTFVETLTKTQINN